MTLAGESWSMNSDAGMFRFDFDAGSQNNDTCHSDPPPHTLPPAHTATSTLVRDIPYSLSTSSIDESALIEVLDFRIVRSSTVSPESGESEYDLIPGEYEGGHALWESSIDLCRYLREVYGSTNSITSAVLELGCGAGLPGIQSLRLGSQTMVFSDFNDDVLTSKTWPNIVLNVPEFSRRRISCLAGDWTGLATHLANAADKRYNSVLSMNIKMTLLSLGSESLANSTLFSPLKRSILASLVASLCIPSMHFSAIQESPSSRVNGTTSALEEAPRSWQGSPYRTQCR